MIPACSYIRVSTGMQVESGSSIPSQRTEIERYAEKHGFSIVEEFVDEGESARTADRPAFQEMIAKAKIPQRSWSAILAWKNSRFARSREDAILYKTLLRKHGIDLIFVGEPFETDTPVGRLLEGVIETIDEFYSSNLAQETIRGQKETAKQGFSCGGVPPYGLMKIETKNAFGAKKTKWGPNPETSPIVKKIYENYALNGMGMKAIAYDLNERNIPGPRGGQWSSNTISGILRRNTEAYLGNLIFNREDNTTIGKKWKPREEWVILNNAWDPIISKDLADKSTEKARSRKRAHTIKKDEEIFILAGKVKCGICGSTMNTSTTGRKNVYSYYRCGKKERSGASACSNPYFRKSVLENIVLENIKTEFLSNELIKEIIEMTKEDWIARQNNNDAEEKALLLKMEDLRGRKDNIIKAIEEDIVTSSDVKDRISDIRTQIDSIKTGLEKINRNRIERFPDITDEMIDAWRNDIFNLTFYGGTERVKNLLAEIIEQVVVYPDEVKIYYTFNPQKSSVSKKSPNWILFLLIRD